MTKPNPNKARGWNIAWQILRPFTIFLCACVLTAGILSTAWKYVYSNYVMPPDPEDTTEVEFVVKRGSSVSGIARQLKEADLVRNKGVFQYLSELIGKGHQLKAGTYTLSRSMTLTQIIDTLAQGDGGTDVMKFTIVEGLSVEGIAQSLVDQKVFASADRFLELCRTGEGIKDKYDFIADVANKGDEGRIYLLEGYLYPDTYEIYVGSSEETVIGKMLDRMNVIYGAGYTSRAEELNMSMDQVVTLASIIEKEGKHDTFDKVSAVFHNRLDQKMALGSDVTVQYALGVKRLVLTQSELGVDSPYNTYTHTGLPVGAICSPGDAAIEAALYPDSDYVDEGYLYFTLTDPETGELAFSKTLEEHNALVEQYRPLWQAYDQKIQQAAANP